MGPIYFVDTLVFSTDPHFIIVTSLELHYADQKDSFCARMRLRCHEVNILCSKSYIAKLVQWNGRTIGVPVKRCILRDKCSPTHYGTCLTFETGRNANQRNFFALFLSWKRLTFRLSREKHRTQVLTNVCGMRVCVKPVKYTEHGLNKAFWLT